MGTMRGRRSSRTKPSGTRYGYPEHFNWRDATSLERTLRFLLPDPLTDKIVENFFNNKTTAATIRQWRYGRRRMPAWAEDIAEARRAEFRKTMEEVEELIAKIKPGPGRTGQNLKEWRARQNLPYPNR